MLTTMPIGFDGLLMQSRESRPSQEQRMVQKCLCYCKSSIWTSLTLTTASKSDWMTIVRRIRGWGEICQKMRVDQDLNKEKGQQLWGVLERYQDVFAWNKGELGCGTLGEHSIDTQGFPPCKVVPGRLSYWEEAEV
jgi:hypothetical protein